MQTTAMDFGELTLAFTDEFTWCWDDKNTGGTQWVSFWHPKAPKGFRALGSMGFNAWESANLKAKIPHADKASKTSEHLVALCVKQNSSEASKKASTPALAAPRDYEEVWRDTGSGGKHYCSVWRPIPPKGYVALGCVVAENTYDKPSTDAVWCVRRDLAFRSIVEQTYTDKGTGSQRDFSAWQNKTPGFNSPDETLTALIAPNTFAAHVSHNQPDGLPEMYVLCLPIPSDEPDPGATPSLGSTAKPAEKTKAKVTETAWIPFTAIADKDYTVPWKLEHSPFYKIERKASWVLAGHINNTTSVAQKTTASTTTGTTDAAADTWGVDVGFSFGFKKGWTSPIGSGEFSMSFSVTTKFSRTETTTKMTSETWTQELIAPPHKAAAIWVGNHTIQVVRGDGTRVGPELSFNDAKSVHYDEFPDK
ncbi:Vps62-related protein [Streptomyces sp. ACT015]|uniref:Vps62-related protein n=1 Tax=Streptomyces sp. ACT015 TaxID=3134807 RepID=UPI003D177533